jgi:hypothetical protein
MAPYATGAAESAGLSTRQNELLVEAADQDTGRFDERAREDEGAARPTKRPVPPVTVTVSAMATRPSCPTPGSVNVAAASSRRPR